MFEGRNRQKMATNKEEKSTHSPRMCHKSIATTAKLHELLFEFFLHPDLALSDY